MQPTGLTQSTDPVKVCGAKTRSGDPCRAAAMANGRCRMHGGLTPRGPALPQFRHGRYSRLLPARLAARYEEGLADPDLLALRDEVALTDARIGQLLEQADAGGGDWAALRRAMEALNGARASRDAAGLASALADLEAAVEGGSSGADAWREIGRALDLRRRLSESETKRLDRAGQLLSVEEVVTLVGTVLGIVRRHTSDARQHAAIVADVRDLFDRRRRGLPDPPG